MNREDYIQISSTIRVYEKGLLDLATLNKLIDAPNLEEFKSILAETSYSDISGEMDSRSHFDKALDNKLVAMYKDCYKMTKDPEVVEILASEYIFHNLKVVVKSYILGKDLTDLLIRITDYDYFGLYEDLKTNGKTTKDWKFKETIDAALKEYEETKDPQRLDMTFDTRHNEYLAKLADKLGSEYISDLVKHRIDVRNINMVLRGKRQNHRVNCVADFIIRGGKIPSDLYPRYYFKPTEELIEEFKHYEIYEYLKEGLEETLKDGRLLHIRQASFSHMDRKIREVKWITFGPEILFAYMQKREREVQLIRIIAVGKINGFTPDQIRERTGELVA